MLFLFFLESVVIFTILWFVFYIAYYIKVLPKAKKLQKSNYKKDSVFKRVFLQLPYCIARDINNYDGAFKEQGLILFEGSQGSGKTISMTKLCNDLKRKYPELLIFSNYGLSFEDSNLDNWEPIVGEINGSLGLVACFDEISLWFGNRNYKDFPFEMLRTITQNRKEHRLILGTCQQVNMVDKQIRRQVSEVRKVRTIGPVTIVWRCKPIFTCDGDIQRYANLGIYWFVQTDEIRGFYNTYRVIENMKRIGFSERREDER